MQYTQSDYIFLGKQVADGKYVSRTTFILTLLLVLLVGVCAGRYLVPAGDTSVTETKKRPLGQGSEVADAVNPNKQLLSSIMQHEEEVRREPGNAEAWEHLGNLYFDVGDPAQAVRAYEKALGIKPANPSVLVDCGVMYRSLKNYDKALEYFKKALAIDPKHEFALFNTGIVLYHDLNRKDEGVASWKALVRINPQAKGPSGELVSAMIKDHETR